MLYFLFMSAVALAVTQSDALNEDKALFGASESLKSRDCGPLRSSSTPCLPYPYEMWRGEQGGDSEPSCGPLSSLSSSFLLAGEMQSSEKTLDLSEESVKARAGELQLDTQSLKGESDKPVEDMKPSVAAQSVEASRESGRIQGLRLKKEDLEQKCDLLRTEFEEMQQLCARRDREEGRLQQLQFDFQDLQRKYEDLIFNIQDLKDSEKIAADKYDAAWMKQETLEQKNTAASEQLAVVRQQIQDNIVLKNIQDDSYKKLLDKYQSLQDNYNMCLSRNEDFEAIESLKQSVTTCKAEVQEGERTMRELKEASGVMLADFEQVETEQKALFELIKLVGLGVNAEELCGDVCVNEEMKQEIIRICGLLQGLSDKSSHLEQTCREQDQSLAAAKLELETVSQQKEQLCIDHEKLERLYTACEKDKNELQSQVERLQGRGYEASSEGSATDVESIELHTEDEGSVQGVTDPQSNNHAYSFVEFSSYTGVQKTHTPALSEKAELYLQWRDNISMALDEISKAVNLPVNEQEAFYYSILDMYRSASYSARNRWYANFQERYKKSKYYEKFPSKELKKGLALLPPALAEARTADKNARMSFIKARSGPTPQGSGYWKILKPRLEDVYFAGLIDPTLSYTEFNTLKTEVGKVK